MMEEERKKSKDIEEWIPPTAINCCLITNRIFKKEEIHLQAFKM